MKCDEFELNLRRNRIMGGVIYFDMLYIPPQPKKVANWVICELEHPQVILMYIYLLTVDGAIIAKKWLYSHRNKRISCLFI